MNNIKDIITKCEQTNGRYVGDLNLLTQASFNCKLSDVCSFKNYTSDQIEQFYKYLDVFFTTDIPTAYIVGFEYFLGTKIRVNSNTLIPRFETEELVINLEKRVRKKYPKGTKLQIADVCSGSGVIGVSLYNRLKCDYELMITFVDISEQALEVTKLNAQSYNLSYETYQGDMLQPLIDSGKQFDIIVSNPPYIGLDEQVQQTVLDYEPSIALYAEDSGLALYKSLINDIILVGKKSFCLMLEIGESQATELSVYLFQTHQLDFEIIKDINGADRNLFLEV
ncbi:peptide chain release factor N(5)-glutamine methyltransferase [Mollicutes bacterium LVI A0039]|nr:peptide chain release factor N(5)-glutamine methyltransferase [Mollicutes bacterium LVI A0039]